MIEGCTSADVNELRRLEQENDALEAKMDDLEEDKASLEEERDNMGDYPDDRLEEILTRLEEIEEEYKQAESWYWSNDRRIEQLKRICEEEADSDDTQRNEDSVYRKDVKAGGGQSDILSLVEKIRQPPDDPARTILLKKPHTWTRDERDLAINAVFDLPDSDPRRHETQEGVTGWYKHYYPGKVQWDATGRMIDPGPAFPLPKESAPVVTHDGQPFEDVLDRFGRHVADTSGDAPVPEVVKSLQSGLNMLTMEKTEKAPAKKWTPPLEEDGDFGPMTRDVLHKTLVRHGPGRAEEALALGRFNGFARKATETLDPLDLKSTTETVFGPLFPRGTPGDVHAMVARTLQDTVNDVAADQDDDRHPSIAVDGDIGPETARGFGRTVGAVGAEDFTRRFARNLGFFRFL
ncbi:MAG: hypothetical protein H7840_10645 [Alphaproteobacteria bacterium]